MARIQQNDEYYSERMMPDEETLKLFDNPSRVVDSLMRDLDSLSSFEYDEEL
jgi:hypothetical protein